MNVHAAIRAGYEDEDDADDDVDVDEFACTYQDRI